jgi:flagellar protein FliO/FliZ
MQSAVTPLLWFIAIVALIPLALWLLKRTRLVAASSGGVMRMVSVLPLAPGQRLVTVEVGSGEERRWLVLGVTAQSISTLHSMLPQAVPDDLAPAPTLPAFAQVLAHLRKNKGGRDEA